MILSNLSKEQMMRYLEGIITCHQRKYLLEKTVKNLESELRSLERDYKELRLKRVHHDSDVSRAQSQKVIEHEDLNKRILPMVIWGLISLVLYSFLLSNYNWNLFHLLRSTIQSSSIIITLIVFIPIVFLSIYVIRFVKQFHYCQSRCSQLEIEINLAMEKSRALKESTEAKCIAYERNIEFTKKEIEKTKQDLQMLEDTIALLLSKEHLNPEYRSLKCALFLYYYFQRNGYNGDLKDAYNKLDRWLEFRHIEQRLNDVVEHINEVIYGMEAELQEIITDYETELREIQADYRDKQRELSQRSGDIELGIHYNTMLMCSEIQKRSW